MTSIEILHNWINQGDRLDWHTLRMDTRLAESYVHLCELIEQEYQAELARTGQRS